MKVEFQKYEGAGNDFIVIDNRRKTFPEPDSELIARLCDRRFGIGADGIMILKEHPEFDFEMVYYNRDGSKSLCGNGSRCITRFAFEQGIIGEKTTFVTTDGPHDAFISGDLVSLYMKEGIKVSRENGHFYADTGSPHVVVFVENLDDFPVVEEGRKIRNSAPFAKEGVNVNFVEWVEFPEAPVLKIRTYERGVEDETLSCGTGITASALVADSLGKNSSDGYVKLLSRGGFQEVFFEPQNGVYNKVVLRGPARFVFKGEIDVD